MTLTQVDGPYAILGLLWDMVYGVFFMAYCVLKAEIPLRGRLQVALPPTNEGNISDRALTSHVQSF